MYIASTLFDFMLKAEEILSFKTVFIVHSFEKNIFIIYIYIYRSEQYISLMSLLFLLVENSSYFKIRQWLFLMQTSVKMYLHPQRLYK